MRSVRCIWYYPCNSRSLTALRRVPSNRITRPYSKSSKSHRSENEASTKPPTEANTNGLTSSHQVDSEALQVSEKAKTKSKGRKIISMLKDAKAAPSFKEPQDTKKPNGSKIAIADKSYNADAQNLEKAFEKMESLEKRSPKGRLSKRRSKLGKSSTEVDCEPGTVRFTSEDTIEKTLDQCIAPKKSDIPQLAHNLDRVLFSPGVHFLQDPRTRVYNFAPFLKNVIHYKDFNFDAAGSYTPVDKHKTLFENAKKFKKQFYSSTSSMTSVLSKFYMLLNNYTPSRVARFGEIPLSGVATKLPSSTFLEPKGTFMDDEKTRTIYSLSADKSCDSEILLSAMGICMETLLTNPEDDFVKFRKDNLDEAPPSPMNAYNYSSYGEFLMRSQLDCFDERLPGNGTFDLKTRASSNIRYNSRDPNVGETDYQIYKLTGQYESYEKEFRDLIKSGALLKYLFQARIGQMDGIFIAYHNINSIFGFQYLPLEELDKIFYSHAQFSTLALDSKDTTLDAHYELDKLPSFIGETQFKFSLEIWETLLRDHIIKDFEASGLEGTAFRLVIETYKQRYARTQQLRVYAIPVLQSEIEQLQSFGNRFPTDFKQDITEKQRIVNTKQHVTELQKFNSNSIKDKTLLSYIISMGDSFIDETKTKYYFLPTRLPKSWRVSYSINRVKTVSKEDFVKVFDLPIQQLSEQFESTNKSKSKFIKKLQSMHQSYEKLGAMRKKQWALKEKPANVYRPKYHF
ncbi:PET127 [Candida theae]|uniref:PET127 n=1 Tax=Candida theae TaxID=1198502 RepID=A0AAD5FZ79_9ASCO|nr:PET127 [Candida theae]KAI5959689.1 PET127 [Candida theae]